MTQHTIQAFGPVTASHPDYWRVAALIGDPPAELWGDGRHDLSELPADAMWWLTVAADIPVALAAVWQDNDGQWRSGCNAELGWRSRPEQERYWPGLHALRQVWLTEYGREIDRITTWLHDVEGAPAGTASVVRVHLDSGWTLTGLAGTVPGGCFARQLELRLPGGLVAGTGFEPVASGL